MSNALPDGNDNQENPKSASHSRPLLYHLALQTSNPLTLRNEIFQAFVAAQGTTAALLSNVFFLLARHPSVWAKLREEVLALGNEEPDFDRLLHMKYLQNILKESTSFPPSPFSQYSHTHSSLPHPIRPPSSPLLPASSTHAIYPQTNQPTSLALRLYPIFPQMNRIALRPTTLPLGSGPHGTSPIYIPTGTIFDTSAHVLPPATQLHWGSQPSGLRPRSLGRRKPERWK